jgi:hypothetical protein
MLANMTFPNNSLGSGSGEQGDKVRRTSAGFGCSVAGFSVQSDRLGPGKTRAALRLWTLSAIVAVFDVFGCGAPATLHITAPSNAVAGAPIAVTVTAMVGGSRDTVINSAIHFTSSDGVAVLPPDYYFTANDAGSHTFADGVILRTPGTQSITATAIGAPGLKGTANVIVSAPATAMQFQ